MSFNVDSFSDAKLDELLTRVTKIPEWELKNTQSERENKRILNFKNKLATGLK